ncbi:hypothetical protein [Mucilaginibacter sp.]|jgi:hypothetical protein|uniref:hypothetical protein n=1 Tax=Mucilaginibacter sp. TaxID=1882438 RepID=UPI002BAEA2A4|nr:hypothetical protein [Mucilaginibacter sp.]HTI58474.1 hypothetical protein [Mucilaginibacter sp.]
MISESEGLHQYKLHPKFVRSIKLKSVVLVIVIWAFLYLLGTLTDSLNQVKDKDVSPALVPWINFFAVLLLCVISIVIIYFTVGSKYKGYIVMMNDKVIGKTNYRNENKIIEFKQIMHAIKTYRGSLFVYDSKKTVIVIPYEIDGYDELEKVISEKSPVTIAGPYSIYQKYSYVTIFLFIALLLTMLTSTNKLLESTIAFLLIGGVILAFKSGYEKVKPHQTVVSKRMPIVAMVFIAIILILLAQKLLEK